MNTEDVYFDRYIERRIGGTTRPVDIEGWELILRAVRGENGFAPEALPAPLYGNSVEGFEQLLGCPLEELYDPSLRYDDPAECLGALETQIRVGIQRLRGTKRLRLQPA